jgi:uncharacterized membrane protein
MQWYYADADEQQIGPLSGEEFDQAVTSGAITPATLVWNEGLSDWQALSAVQAANVTPAINLPGGQAACYECRNTFPENELVEFEGKHVCAGCKPAFFQRLSEGGVALSVGGTGDTPNAELIIRAKSTISGSWWASFGAILLAWVVLMPLMAIPLVNIIAMLIVPGALIGGLVRYFVVKARGADSDIGVIFSGFPRFGTLLGIGILIYLIMFACYIPYIISLIFLFFAAATTMTAQPLPIVIVMIIAMGCWALSFPFVTSFIMAFPAAMEEDRPTVGMAMGASRVMMKGHRWKFFCMFFRLYWLLFVLYIASFALLGLVSPFGAKAAVVPVLLIIGVVIGYIQRLPIALAAYAHFYEDVRGLAQE